MELAGRNLRLEMLHPYDMAYNPWRFGPEASPSDVEEAYQVMSGQPVDLHRLISGLRFLYLTYCQTLRACRTNGQIPTPVLRTTLYMLSASSLTGCLTQNSAAPHIPTGHR